MIQIDINTNNTIIEQFDKVKEEFEEVRESIANAKEREYRIKSYNDEVIAECFDLIQATNRIIRMLTSEDGYKKHYKVHLRKLQHRAEQGKIKINEYIEI